MYQSLFISERKTYVKIYHRVCTPLTWPPFVGASGGGGSPQHPSPTGIGEVSVPQPSAAGNCPRGTVPHQTRTSAMLLTARCRELFVRHPPITEHERCSAREVRLSHPFCFTPTIGSACPGRRGGCVCLRAEWSLLKA